jgi:hypothetical protein
MQTLTPKTKTKKNAAEGKSNATTLSLIQSAVSSKPLRFAVPDRSPH